MIDVRSTRDRLAHTWQQLPALRAGAQLLLSTLTLLLLWHTGVLRALTGTTPLPDFDAYLVLARAVFENSNPYTVSSMQTLGPPLVISPFLPLALLPETWARSFFTTASLVAAIWSCWHIAGLWAGARVTITLALLLALLTTFPARFTLLMGQSNLLIMAGITAFLTQSRPVLGLSVSIVLKSQYALCWAALLNQQRRTALLIGGILVAVFLGTLPMLTPSSYTSFLTATLTPLVTHANPTQGLDYYNQTLTATLQRLGLPPVPQLATGILWLGAVVYAVRTSNRAATVVLSVLLAPVVWQHYFVVLFPVSVLLFVGSTTARQRALVLVAATLSLIEFPWLHSAARSLPLGLVASHFFAGGVLLFISALQQGKKQCYTTLNGK